MPCFSGNLYFSLNRKCLAERKKNTLTFKYSGHTNCAYMLIDILELSCHTISPHHRAKRPYLVVLLIQTSLLRNCTLKPMDLQYTVYIKSINIIMWSCLYIFKLKCWIIFLDENTLWIHKYILMQYTLYEYNLRYAIF